MRLPICIAVIATSSLFTSLIATPTPLAHSSRGGSSAFRNVERGNANADNNKYFHEPGGTDTLGHYDARYFKEIVSDEERSDAQKHMVRAYLTFFRENELDTWIAHGTLLGWWWNGKRLPWDSDLDTQVSETTLHHLGGAHNQTRYKYVSHDGTVQREYLLDVNPWIWQRERGDGANIIDARWIDTRNGLFIDITGLSEVHPDTHPGWWSCKNYHMYHTSDLYPMRETMFEGVMAKVPYDYDKILVDEYKEKALTATEFEGHRWEPTVKEWMKTQHTLDMEEANRKEKETLARIEAEERAKLD
ncbi:mannosylphosphate transferase [Pyrenophora seminiperda CCB06]|uniref:Mannosylphosphate transferase n=1 Tax=Pyrenophora seminiperda CCB06 TaxID=1302712 RepID=A0A3M7LY98_9PLEO|nr:mannosylphosphate transferase [Pyrenophora seminiperda CCB06]